MSEPVEISSVTAVRWSTTGVHLVNDLVTLVHIVLALAALVLPIVVGVRLLEGPEPEPFAW